MKILYIILVLIICHGDNNNNDCGIVEDTNGFTNQNLQLDDRIDRCYNLKTICGDSDIGCLHYVFSFEEGDHHMTNEEWVWEQISPNLYSIEGYEFNVFPSTENDDCWNLQALHFDLTSEACPCSFAPLRQAN